MLIRAICFFGCARGFRCLWLIAIGLICGGNLKAQTGLYQVINWNPSSSTNVVGYKVYYGTSSGHYSQSVLVSGGVTSIRIDGFEPGTSYFAAVTTVNGNGQESAYSREVYFTTPAAPRLMVTPWTDIYGITYVNVSSTDLVSRLWELDYSFDAVTWYPYDYGFYSNVAEPYIETDLSYIPRMFFRIVMF